jgi:hypothetical protein
MELVKVFVGVFVGFFTLGMVAELVSLIPWFYEEPPA